MSKASDKRVVKKINNYAFEVLEGTDFSLCSDDLDWIQDAFAVFEPPENIEIDEWVEKYVNLPADKTCPEPGPLRISRTPYTRGILKAFANPNIDRLTIVFGRQLGKSQGIQYASMCWAIVQRPGPILFVLPNEELVSYTSTHRIQPLFQACEPVKNRITPDRNLYTQTEMTFKTCVVSLVGAGSASKLMSRPVRYLFIDESDQIKEHAGHGADPLKTVEQTTTAFAGRKIIDTSTPTTEQGNIWQQLAMSQKIFEYWIPCPQCNTYQVMYWTQIRYKLDAGDNYNIADTAYYECIQCKAIIDEIQKHEAVQKGQWRCRDNAITNIMENIHTPFEQTQGLDEILKTGKYRRLGFHLPKWYGLFYFSSINEAVREYLEAMQTYKDTGYTAKLRDWTVYWAARPFQDVTSVATEQKVNENIIEIPELECPQNTVALTMGIDPGQGGYWFVVVAWLKDMSCHVVHYGFVVSPLDLSSIVHDNVYPCGDRYINIWRAGMDTGGSQYGGATETMTEAAYDWIRRYGQGKVFATKGGSNYTGARLKQTHVETILDMQGKRYKTGQVIWLIDTAQFKDSLHYKISLKAGQEGRITFHKDTSSDFFQQLYAEEKRINPKTGKSEWVRVRQNNHYLDCLVIAMAMADIECLGGIKAKGMQTGQGNITRNYGRRVLSSGI